MVGLNEMIKEHLGVELHNSEEALRFGLNGHRPYEPSLQPLRPKTQNALCAGADPGRIHGLTASPSWISSITRKRPGTW